MSESTEHLNGTAPAEEQPCDDCATGGEKALAVLGILFGVFLIVMAFDMFTGGQVSGYVKERTQ
jgi:hypothetical protein